MTLRERQAQARKAKREAYREYERKAATAANMTLEQYWHFKNQMVQMKRPENGTH